MSDRRHTGRDTSGRYASTLRCDCCGKGISNNNYCSDPDLCNEAGNPGLYLCERKRCVAKYENLGIEARRALFLAGRARNESGA